MKNAFLTVVFGAVALVAGCAGYTWGTSVPEEYRTVSVPVFENLTEISEIGPIVSQYTLREFMRQGYFEKHVNRMRMCYRSRRRELIELLRPYSERLHPVGAQAGTYLLVRVDSEPDDLALCAKALEAGVRVWPISPCFMGPVPEEYRAAVLLGYGNLSREQMRRGVELLAKAWAL